MSTMYQWWRRPEWDAVDYETSRFVVASATGIKFADGTVLERGDEFPRGLLEGHALRCAYKAHRIETVAFAADYDSDLREACARRGVTLEEHQDSLPASQPVKRPIIRRQKA